MNALQKLCRIGWSQWYVRLGLGVAVGVGILICISYGLRLPELRNSLGFTIIDSLDRKFEHLGPGIFMANWARVHESREKFISLASLNHGIEELKIIIGSFFLTAYAGFSLDAGYHWLRKRRAAKAPES